MGADFPAERFLRTPIRTIDWLLKELDDLEKLRANISSMTVAQLTNIVLQVAHGMSGSKKPGPKTTPKTFLPFPDWRPVRSQSDGPDQPTKFILAVLAKQRAIPMHVFTALTKGVEQRP